MLSTLALLPTKACALAEPVAAVVVLPPLPRIPTLTKSAVALGLDVVVAVAVTPAAPVVVTLVGVAPPAWLPT